MHTRMYVCKHICVAICACEWWKSAAIRRQIVLMPMLWHVCIILNTLWRQPARACAAHVYVFVCTYVCVCVEALKHEINAQSIANSLKDTRATKGERDKQHNTHNTQTLIRIYTHTNNWKKLRHINLYEVLRQATAEAEAAAATPNKNCPKVNFYFRPTLCAALFLLSSHLYFWQI